MKRPVLALFLLAGCTKPAPPAPPVEQGSVTPATTPDSLVLTLPDSTEVWLVRGRQGVAASGATCQERNVELRKGGRRSMVPLLFVREAPRLLHGRLIAALSNRCLDQGEYAIDPATAYPSNVRGTR